MRLKRKTKRKLAAIWILVCLINNLSMPLWAVAQEDQASESAQLGSVTPAPTPTTLPEVSVTPSVTPEIEITVTPSVGPTITPTPIPELEPTPTLVALPTSSPTPTLFLIQPEEPLATPPTVTPIVTPTVTPVGLWEKIKKIFNQEVKNPKLTKSGLRSNEKIDVELNDFTGKEVNVELFRGEEPVKNIEVKTEYDHLLISKPKNFKPGKYTIKISTNDSKDGLIEQDFIWGVLAVNTNKSVFLSGENAYLQMASLDENGRTICNASLKLEIRPPDGEVTTLSTQDGTIKYSETCGADNVTDNPDYFAYFETKETGIYNLKLTNLDNDYEIEDSFEVKKSISFEVERIGATRINPFKSTYKMSFNIKANEDFKGEVIETVPDNFEIIDSHKIISWLVDWKEGENYELSYEYKAPEVSPQFYLLGPLVMKRTIYDLKITDLEIKKSMDEAQKYTEIAFIEARQWQIAADAEATVDITIFDATDEFGPSPTMVFTSFMDGYVFYIDGTNQDLVYSKTTNGGVTWGAAVTVEADTTGWTNVSVWYDQWTPGDTSNTKIHIAAADITSGDVFYTYLDTSTDTLRGSITQVLDGTTFTPAANAAPSITKSGEGNLFICANFATYSGSAGGGVAKSSNGTDWSVYTTNWSSASLDQIQLLPLKTGDDIIAIKADTDNNYIRYQIHDEKTNAWADSWSELSGSPVSLIENTSYDQWFSATIKKSTGDIYLAFNNYTYNANNDMEFWTFSDSSRSWTQKTNLFEDTQTLWSPVPVINESNGDIYVAYATGAVNTMSIKFKKSTNGGTSWSAESAQINSGNDDYRYLRGGLLSSDRLQIAWYDDDDSAIYANTLAVMSGSSIYIDESMMDATDEFGPSPAVVFTTDQIGYVFFIDATSQSLVYRKTTNGGGDWVDYVVIDTDVAGWTKVSVWYDQWTPGDNSGTKIHIAASDDTVTTGADIYYTFLDTSTDTLKGSVVKVLDGATITEAANAAPSITKGGGGDLFIAANFALYGAAAGGAVAKSTYGVGVGDSWTDITPTGWSAASLDQIQLLSLKTGNDILAIRANTATNWIEYQVYDDTTDTWDGGWSSNQTIDTTVYEATNQFNPSPMAVFTSRDIGYVFYVDATTQYLVYSKTTNGGNSWSGAVTIESTLTWMNVAVWYDQWTPEDTTGTKIHIAASDSTDDDIFYTYLDTNTDTLKGSMVAAVAGSTVTVLIDGPPSITKGKGGALFVSGNFTTPAGGGVAKSTDGAGNIWTDVTPSGWSSTRTDQIQLLSLKTDDDVIAIKADTTSDVIQYWVYSEQGDSWTGSWSNLSGSSVALVDNATDDQWFASSLKKSTGDIYLAFNNYTANAANDMEFWSFSDSSRGWTQKTNVITDNATVLSATPVVNETTGDVYVAYARGTVNSATDIYYKMSTDGGTTWGSESEPLLTTANDDYRYVRSNLLSPDRPFLFYYNDDTNALYGQNISSGHTKGSTRIGPLVDNGSYDNWFSATLKKSTGDIYLVFNNYTANAANDMEFWTFSDSTRSWAQKTNLFTDNATLLSPFPFMDEDTGDVYVAYLRGVLANDMDVYFKKSSDGGVSWTPESDSLSRFSDDRRRMTGNMTSGDRLYVVWDNDDLNDLRGNTIPFSTSSALTVSGTFYLVDGTTTAIAGNGGQCDWVTSNLMARVNGSDSNLITTSCSGQDGSFSFANILASAGDTITIYSTGADKANRIYVSDASSDTGMSIYKNGVVVADENDGTLSILDLLDYDSDQNDTDMLFDADDSSPDTLVVESGAELYVWIGDTFAPGGNITTPKINITGTYLGDSEILTLTGEGIGSSQPLSIGGTFTAGTNTVVYNATREIDITAAEYYNLSLNPSSGTEIYTLSEGNLGVGGSFITSGAGTLLVDGETNDPDIDINGSLVIASGHTFSSSSTGSFLVAEDFINNGTFTANSGTVTFDDALKISNIFIGGNGSTNPFFNLFVTTGGKQMKFDETEMTGVGGTFSVQGTNCTTGRVFLDSTTNDNLWDINVTGSVDIDYTDVEDSNAVIALTANNSTGSNNTNWTVNAGVCGGENQAPSFPTDLTQTKLDYSPIISGTWVNFSSINIGATASDPDASDTLYLCVENKTLGVGFTDVEDNCGVGISYSGTAVGVGVTISNLADGQYHWQVKVKDAAGVGSSWVAFGVGVTMDFGVDTTAPTGGVVYDGLDLGIDRTFNDGSLSELSANWSGIDADVSGLNYYEYSIGTGIGETDVKNWTNIGTGTSAVASGLSLKTSTMYFYNVRATDNAGNIQTPISSNGQKVSPSLTFSVSPSVLTFDNLNVGNDFSSTKQATLTTSTNAYGGYIIKTFATDYLRSGGVGHTIPDFNGGTYVSPAEWGEGNIGFGYTSSDTTIQGLNKFGVGIGNTLYAPISQTGPGEIVADHTDNIQGSPIADEQYVITYKVKTNNTQQAENYGSTVVYTITALY